MPLLVWVLMCANANGAFYTHRSQGFHGYECLRVVKQKPVLETPKVMRALLDDALEVAYAQPTFEHVRRYLILQKRHMGKSEAFSRMWERVLWAYPLLDERARMPVAQGALKIHKDGQRAQMQAVLQHGAQRYVLLVCVREQNAFFFDVVHQFCEEYGWDARVIAPHDVGYKGVFVDQEGVAALCVEVFPAWFLVHKTRNILVRLGAGVLSVEEVAYRVKRALDDVGEKVWS